MRRKVWVPLVWLVSLVVVAGVAWWAARATFTPPQVSEEQLPPATYTVAEASIGASLPVTVTVTWGTHPLAAGSLSGMVTAINLPTSGIVKAGDVLLSVDLKPVVVAQGSVPAFRELSAGVSGDDVRQLQAFLQAAGYLDAKPDGQFRSATADAVCAWQEALKVDCTGVVQASDILFVAPLPARVVFDDAVVVGAVISPGQPILSVVNDTPMFQAAIGANTSSAVVPQSGQSVTVSSPDSAVTWQATVAQVSPTTLGGYTASLTGAKGGPVCADQCDLFSYTPGGLMVNGTLVVSPVITGPAVPLAAVGTAPDGSRFVLHQDGTRATVTVRGGDASLLIVDGVQGRRCRPTVRRGAQVTEVPVQGLHLEARDLTFAYRRGGERVLDGVSLTMVPGTVTVLTGASGAGKSTLLYVLTLLLRASSGTVIWDGSPVESLADAGRSQLRAARSGFVFQDAMLDPSRTVGDNVTEGALFSGLDPAVTASRARSLLDRFGVAHRADHRPGEISGGQAQRVALCRALVTDPDVVFADEPTGNLDHDSAAVVWEALRGQANRGATVVVATHQEELANLADQHIVVGDSR